LYIDTAVATGVEFTITALNTDIGGLRNPTYSGGVTPIPADPANSTFQIPAGSYNPTVNYGTLKLDDSQNPPLTAPVFIIPVPGTTAIPATFGITQSDGTAIPAALQGIIIPLYSSSATYPDPNNKVDCSGYLWEKGSAPFAKVTGLTTGITAGTALAFPIDLAITPGTKNGVSKVFIEIPVVMAPNAQSSNNVDPVTWYIRGGINNAATDMGAAFNEGDGSLGGAIIIGVGEFQKNAAGLIISSKPIQ